MFSGNSLTYKATEASAVNNISRSLRSRYPPRWRDYASYTEELKNRNGISFNLFVRIEKYVNYVTGVISKINSDFKYCEDPLKLAVVKFYIYGINKRLDRLYTYVNSRLPLTVQVKITIRISLKNYTNNNNNKKKTLLKINKII